MMKLNKKVELGILAIRQLRNTNRITSGNLAIRVGTTKNFMEQILQDLRKAGITGAVKGPGGGNFLARKEGLTAYDVATAVGQDLEINNVDADFSPVRKLEIEISEAYRSVAV